MSYQIKVYSGRQYLIKDKPVLESISPKEFNTGCEISLREAREFILLHSNNHERMLRTEHWKLTHREHYDKCFAIIEEYKKAVTQGYLISLAKRNK